MTLRCNGEGLVLLVGLVPFDLDPWLWVAFVCFECGPTFLCEGNVCIEAELTGAVVLVVPCWRWGGGLFVLCGYGGWFVDGKVLGAVDRLS